MDIKTELYDIIKKCLQSEDYPFLQVTTIKNGYSYKLFSKVVLKFYTNLKNSYRFEIANDISYIDKISDIYPVVFKSNSIRIDTPKKKNAFYDFIENVQDYLFCLISGIVASSGPNQTFGCCSRMKECSLARKCINPNIKLANNCYYKTVLESGIVYQI